MDSIIAVTSFFLSNIASAFSILRTSSSLFFKNVLASAFVNFSTFSETATHLLKRLIAASSFVSSTGTKTISFSGSTSSLTSDFARVARVSCATLSSSALCRALVSLHSGHFLVAVATPPCNFRIMWLYLSKPVNLGHVRTNKSNYQLVYTGRFYIPLL